MGEAFGGKPAEAPPDAPLVWAPAGSLASRHGDGRQGGNGCPGPGHPEDQRASPNSGRRRMPIRLPPSAINIQTQPCRLPEAVPSK